MPSNGTLAQVMRGLRDSDYEGLFKYEKVTSTGIVWAPSDLYLWSPDMMDAVYLMATKGIYNLKLWIGDDNWVYGMVNIAAFLAQCMQETIRYNACDETNWSDSLTNPGTTAGGVVYPASASCGQLGQSYQDYQCSAEEDALAGGQMACDVDPDMELRGETQAMWFGAPPTLFCAPKSKVPKAPRWDANADCPWCPESGWRDPDCDTPPVETPPLQNYWDYVNGGGKCYDYANQQAGGWVYSGGGCIEPGCPNMPAVHGPEHYSTDGAAERARPCCNSTYDLAPVAGACHLWPAPVCAGPNEPCFRDPTCSDDPPRDGGLGCNAGGLGANCRFCGFGPYPPCPELEGTPRCGAEPAATCAGPNEPCFWDPTCSLQPPREGGLGCNAGGVHANCRFCGFGHYPACPGGPRGGGSLLESKALGDLGRTDVEGCCWWGRGVIQTTGVCNFGKLNYFMGKRAADEGREANYPDIDFCKRPDAICDPEGPPELKWVAGFFYWMQTVQPYDVRGWDYIDELKAWVDGGMDLSDTSFIDGASGIVNRGCHDPPCGTGPLHATAERRRNFAEVITAMKLPPR